MTECMSGRTNSKSGSTTTTTPFGWSLGCIRRRRRRPCIPVILRPQHTLQPPSIISRFQLVLGHTPIVSQQIDDYSVPTGAVAFEGRLQGLPAPVDELFGLEVGFPVGLGNVVAAVGVG